MEKRVEKGSKMLRNEGKLIEAKKRSKESDRGSLEWVGFGNIVLHIETWKWYDFWSKQEWIFLEKNSSLK